MSRRSVETVLSPDVVGLLRCNKKGERQLHDWVDGKIELRGGIVMDQPCECAL